MDLINIGCENIEELREKLSKQEQIKYYDTIYNQYLESSSYVEGKHDIVIPGLSYVIKLAIYMVYYREELYSYRKSFHPQIKLKNSTLIQQKLIKLLSSLTDNFTMITFCETIFNILNLITNPHENSNLRETNMFLSDDSYMHINKPLFFYVILGNEAITSIDGIIDGLFDENMYKCYVAAQPYNLKYGPHNGNYTENPSSFFFHDMSHYIGTTIYVLEELYNSFGIETIIKYQELYNSVKNYPSSFKYRWICFIYFGMFFDGVINVTNTDFEENMKIPLVIYFSTWEIEDALYCIKWLLKTPNTDLYEKYNNYLSTDISEESFQELMDILNPF